MTVKGEFSARHILNEMIGSSVGKYDTANQMQEELQFAEIHALLAVAKEVRSK